jgi:putative two-component system response regulator
MFGSDSSQKELLDAVWRMANIAEYREGSNVNHLERIRGYCLVLARGMGCSNKEAQIISTASQLHDIGKVGLPESLLLKTDGLKPFEMELIQKHTIVGSEILKGSPSPILQMGECITLTHHERWDGSGYPNGLKGDEIPLAGRICALADVFDALTTPRTYKAEVSVEEALRLIKKASRTLFDPQVVKTFEDEFNEITKIRKSHL